MPGLDNRPISAEVGQWVLQEACSQAARWRAAGASEFRMGVNLFGSQFRSGNLVDKVHAALYAAVMPPDTLELEITENIMLRHDEEIIAPLRQLRHEGMQIAFDDYGTGYASLSILKRFPLTRLKIDMSFVQAIAAAPRMQRLFKRCCYSEVRLLRHRGGRRNHGTSRRTSPKGL